MLRFIFVLLTAVFLGIGLEMSAAAGALKIGDPAPKIDGSEWINTSPLNADDFRGHVLLIEFWTYG